MQFQKENMAGQDYSWTSNVRVIFKGAPTRRMFDRYNGDQVLFIINCYASQLENFTIEDGLQIEQRILRGLPVEAKSEISVLHWISQNAMMAT